MITNVLRSDLLRLQLHLSDVLEKSLPIFHTQLLLQQNDVGLVEKNDSCTSHYLQRLTRVPEGPSLLGIPTYSVVSSQELPGCAHRFSRSLGLVTCAPGMTSPVWRGPYDGLDECGFHVVHVAASWRVCLDVPSNRCLEAGDQ